MDWDCSYLLNIHTYMHTRGTPTVTTTKIRKIIESNKHIFFYFILSIKRQYALARMACPLWILT